MIFSWCFLRDSNTGSNSELRFALNHMGLRVTTRLGMFIWPLPSWTITHSLILAFKCLSFDDRWTCQPTILLSRFPSLAGGNFEMSSFALELRAFSSFTSWNGSSSALYWPFLQVAAWFFVGVVLLLWPNFPANFRTVFPEVAQVLFHLIKAGWWVCVHLVDYELHLFHTRGVFREIVHVLELNDALGFHDLILDQKIQELLNINP